MQEEEEGAQILFLKLQIRVPSCIFEAIPIEKFQLHEFALEDVGPVCQKRLHRIFAISSDIQYVTTPKTHGDAKHDLSYIIPYCFLL